MTGYGRGECSRDGFKLTVEISAVNRKQSEIGVNLPRELEVLEAQIRDLINTRISRGKITTRVTLHAGEGFRPVRVRLNRNLAEAYVKELRLLGRELKLNGELSLDLMARLPGVLEADGEISDAEDFWPATEKATQAALAALLKMRTREGAHLARDLAGRMNVMRKAAEKVRKQAPQVSRRYREQLLERIKTAGLDTPAPDDERLLKEVVYFADRSDITEELTRLQSHFQQFDDCVKANEPVGRTLDFLAQEMNREINTIGSKANDATISQAVVVLKTELEKFREQAMNVE
jgi:uncharacterized protein (TIGR00255 family)